MTKTTRISVISRRTLVASGAAALWLPALLARAGNPSSLAPSSSAGPTSSSIERSAVFEADFKAILAGATPVDGKITLELPEIADNGNFVPVTVSVESPMTDTDYVKTIHILSTNNPVARVATFQLSPLNAVARVQSRMRLSKTQDVIALAVMSNGTITIATARVKVTIGGCAG